MYIPGVGLELSLNQSEEKLLNEEEKRRYQVITGAVMYLAQVTRYAWPGPKASPSPTSEAASGLLPARMLTGVTTPTTAGPRHHTS